MSSPLSSSLMDLNVSFPIKYSIDFDCSESNLEEVIEKVASFTSKVYATFPALSNDGRKQLKKVGVWFSELDEHPSATECEQFEKSLKKEIIRVLNRKKKTGAIELLTDYYPEETLREVAKSVFNKQPQLGFLFPYKTSTQISVKEERKKVCLDMNFVGD